ncbi:META domain-containing protein [Spirosomataceae bacterium TFI 002]|nr:META domain-containing protein [Spirosomataceae bacterium TFI 002]
MTKIISLLSIFLFTYLSSCEENKLENQESIEGTWIFKEFFLGDAIMLGCGWEAKDVRSMTLKIEKDGDQLKISGSAPVNNYFGNFDLLSFDKTTSQGKVKVGPIGSTKMAGPEPVMQCETMFLQMLQEAGDIGFSDSGELQIGRFRTAESNPRDGGTYMVFEKAKLD